MPTTPASPHPVTRSVGFIGLGNMGMPMVLNLLAAAHPDEEISPIGNVVVTGRSRDRLEPALSAGALWADNPVEIAERCPVIILMVPDLPQVEELLFATTGIANASGSVIVIVASSVSPTGIRDLDERLRAQTAGRITLVDAPVSGGTEGAAAGTLSIMVGGTAEDAEAVLPILAACGTPVHLGPLGSGDVAKACNQLIVAATMAAVSEASVIAERSGLDLDVLLTLLSGGYAGSRVLETKKQRLVERDYSPTGVAKFMVKDLTFATAAAESTKTQTPTLDAALQSFTNLTNAGLGDNDLAVIHRWVREQTR